MSIQMGGRAQIQGDQTGRATSAPLETELDAILGIFPGAALVCDAAGHLTRVNAAAGLFGLKPDQKLPTVEELGARQRLYSQPSRLW